MSSFYDPPNNRQCTGDFAELHKMDRLAVERLRKEKQQLLDVLEEMVRQTWLLIPPGRLPGKWFDDAKELLAQGRGWACPDHGGFAHQMNGCLQPGCKHNPVSHYEIDDRNADSVPRRQRPAEDEFDPYAGGSPAEQEAMQRLQGERDALLASLEEMFIDADKQPGGEEGVLGRARAAIAKARGSNHN